MENAVSKERRDRRNDRSKTEKIKEKKTYQSMDLPFFILVVLLTSIGVIMMFSASFVSSYSNYKGDSTYLFIRQAGMAVVGIIVAYFISHIDYKILKKSVFKLNIAFVIHIVSTILLLLVLFIGTEENGAKRWIMIPGVKITVQPSEITKLTMVLYTATLVSFDPKNMKTFLGGLLRFIIILIPVCTILVFQKHLSALILIVATTAVIVFIGGIRLLWVGVSLPSIALGIWVLLTKTPHSKARIAIYKNPWADVKDKGFQTVQSLMAIGSGGLFGLGIGKSRQKYLYLPEQHNDFIFAIVCEELGFVGACMILLIFALLIIRGYWIAVNARDTLGTLIAAGFTTLIALQVFLNVAVVTNLIPVTGISLPFFSYGGTALGINLAEMGFILSVSRQIPGQKAG